MQKMMICQLRLLPTLSSADFFSRFGVIDSRILNSRTSLVQGYSADESSAMAYSADEAVPEVRDHPISFGDHVPSAGSDTSGQEDAGQPESARAARDAHWSVAATQVTITVALRGPCTLYLSSCCCIVLVCSDQASGNSRTILEALPEGV